jgi:hypothetical protein
LKKGNQEWRYNHKVRHYLILIILNQIPDFPYHLIKQIHQLLHVITGKCLEMSKDGSKLMMTVCEPSNVYQQWTFKDFNETKAKEHGMLFQ